VGYAREHSNSCGMFIHLLILASGLRLLCTQPVGVTHCLASPPAAQDSAISGHRGAAGRLVLSPKLMFMSSPSNPEDTDRETAVLQSSWRFRVVCDDGAYVRTGLELSSRHLYTIPSNSLLEVTERCINNQGLARLRTADGWISEMLNPLSGQVGHLSVTSPLYAVAPMPVLTPAPHLPPRIRHSEAPLLSRCRWSSRSSSVWCTRGGRWFGAVWS
jgi:hypothetical protein